MRQWGAGWGLRATAFGMLSAACLLGASLAVAPPPMDLRLPLVGVVLALLTGAAGSITAAGARRTASLAVERVAPALTPMPSAAPIATSPPPEGGPPAAASPDQGHAELAAATRDLRNLLAEQRAELAAFREQTETSAHETTMLGARLAGLALDAEVRLSAVIEHAAEASQRAERTLPEFAELLRRGLAERSASAPSPDAVREAIQAGAAAAVAAATGRFDAAVEGAARSLGAVMADASGQIAALADVAVALRRDATALDEAAGAVASAGANVIGGVADAMGHAESFARAAAETREAAQAAIEAAAQAATQGVMEAAAALRREAESLLALAVHALPTAAAPASSAPAPVAPITPMSPVEPAAPLDVGDSGGARGHRAETAEARAPEAFFGAATPEPGSPPLFAPSAQASQPAQASQAAPGSRPAAGFVAEGMVAQLMEELGEVMRRVRATLDQRSAADDASAAASAEPVEVAGPIQEQPRLRPEPVVAAPPPLSDNPAPATPPIATLALDGDARNRAVAPPTADAPSPMVPPQEPPAAPWVAPEADAPEPIEATIRRLRAMAAALENGSLSAAPGRRTG